MRDRMDDSYSEVPDGTEWCPECNGYGSSLQEPSDRCSRCGGTGLVAVANSGEKTSNEHEPGRLGHEG
jgi:DnaJ-class molecular chaperone